MRVKGEVRACQTCQTAFDDPGFGPLKRFCSERCTRRSRTLSGTCHYCRHPPAPGYVNCARHVLYQRRYQRARKGVEESRSDDSMLEALLADDPAPRTTHSFSDLTLVREVLTPCRLCGVWGPPRLLREHLRVDHGLAG